MTCGRFDWRRFTWFKLGLVRINLGVVAVMAYALRYLAEQERELADGKKPAVSGKRKTVGFSLGADGGVCGSFMRFFRLSLIAVRDHAPQSFTPLVNSGGGGIVSGQ